MRKKRSWRYYCDHCGKSGGSGGAMSQHERHCTLNPTRECRMCALAGGAPTSMPRLIAALRGNGVVGAREAADGCPACVLAAIRQDRRERGIDMRKMDGPEAEAEWNRYDFDYKKEAQAFMDDAIRRRNEDANYEDVNYAY